MLGSPPPAVPARGSARFASLCPLTPHSCARFVVTPRPLHLHPLFQEGSVPEPHIHPCGLPLQWSVFSLVLRLSTDCAGLSAQHLPLITSVTFHYPPKEETQPQRG